MSRAVVKQLNDRDYTDENGVWTAALVAATREDIASAEESLRVAELINWSDFQEEWDDGRPCLTVGGDDILADTKGEWMAAMRQQLKGAA